jgi:hypothetical protein
VDRGWERWAGLAGLGFVVLYVAAFALGIEVGDTDADIRTYLLAFWVLLVSGVLAFGRPQPAT